MDQKKNGTSRKIVGIKLLGKGIIRSKYKVFKLAGDKQIGYVTSGGYSPTFKKSIALALLQNDEISIGKEVLVEIRNKKLPAIIVKTPFYMFGGKK